MTNSENDMYETAAANFLELSSIQRLQILFKLADKKSKPSDLLKEFDSTKQEVYRNFARLEDGHLIVKDSDGHYDLTEFGKTICNQVPALVFFVSEHEVFSITQLWAHAKKILHENRAALIRYIHQRIGKRT